MGTSMLGIAFVATSTVIAPPPADFVGDNARVVVTQATAPLPLVESFSEQAEGGVAGVLVVPGAQLGEMCIGQSRAESPAGFERTSGTPSLPLTIAPPAFEDGLYIADSRVTGVADGPSGDDIGEGAITILFDRAHQTLGLFLAETDGGSGMNRFECFDSDGALIDEVILPTGNRALTFTSLGAPIRVITFNTTDPLGACLDNLRLKLPQGLLVAGGPAPHPIAEDFGAYADGEHPGVLAVPGASLAEACVGQGVVELPSNFEVTFGQPAFPPTLAMPAAADGLFFIGAALMGLAQGTQSVDIGEGAITILYDVPQAVVGLSTVDTDFYDDSNGLMRFECFASDGTLIGVAEALSFPDRELRISTTSAPIAVMTITNSDPWGVRVDDLRHFVPGP